MTIRYSLDARANLSRLGGMVINLWRRHGWFLETLTSRKAVNILQACAHIVCKSETLSSWPIALKIDISPLCNLRCTFCIHAQPNGNPRLLKQEFRGHQRMTVAQYRQLIKECEGKLSAVSLYYLGDPITHPDLDEMCRIASEAKMAVHINTNLSMHLTDNRVRQIVTSGLTHLTICVDGLSQIQYQKTRVGGRIDLVLENLRRVCLYRRQIKRTYPKVEVQFIKFTHNIHELEDVFRLCQQMDVDQFSSFWGSLANCTDKNPDTFHVLAARKNTWLPQCINPYVYMLIKYNGDVIPCCNYRLGTQYTCVDNPRCLGNVFETSVHAVWNSAAYRHIRQMVANPESIGSEPFQREYFCYGCPAIFDTDLSREDLRTQCMEQFYTFDARGRPVRRPEAIPPSVGFSDRTDMLESPGPTRRWI